MTYGTLSRTKLCLPTPFDINQLHLVVALSRQRSGTRLTINRSTNGWLSWLGQFWCAAECAVRFEPIRANAGFFATLTKCFRAGLVVDK
jgi:hypothetical protein